MKIGNSMFFHKISKKKKKKLAKIWQNQLY